VKLAGGLNQYRYALNPTGWVDPSGLSGNCLPPTKPGCSAPDNTPLAGADEGEPHLPEAGGDTPQAGSHKETYASKPVKPEDATTKWEQFLGDGPYTDRHPRTKNSDPDRLVSADGKRSIRYGNHEMSGSPTKHHYHEENWTLELKGNVMNIENTVVRVPLPKKPK